MNSLMSAQHHWSWNPLAQNPLPRIILDNNIPMRGTCSRRQKKRSNHCLLAAVTELPTVVLVCSGCHHKILQNECLKHILFLLSVQEARRWPQGVCRFNIFWQMVVFSLCVYVVVCLWMHVSGVLTSSYRTPIILDYSPPSDPILT